MEKLHKIVFWFNSTQNEIALRARLEGQLTGVANSVKASLLNPSDQVEAVLDLSRQPDDINGAVYEAYIKLVSDTAKSVFKRDEEESIDTSKARTDLADAIRKAIEHPTVSNIREMD